MHYIDPCRLMCTKAMCVLGLGLCVFDDVEGFRKRGHSALLKFVHLWGFENPVFSFRARIS